MCRAIRGPSPGPPWNGFALTATTLKKPKRKAAGENRARGELARADRQQDFFAERVLELFELERRFALVAQHFEPRRPALFRDFDAAAFNIHNVHLQRFDQKVPVVAAIWTGQRHLMAP